MKAPRPHRNTAILAFVMVAVFLFGGCEYYGELRDWENEPVRRSKSMSGIIGAPYEVAGKEGVFAMFAILAGVMAVTGVRSLRKSKEMGER